MSPRTPRVNFRIRQETVKKWNEPRGTQKVGVFFHIHYQELVDEIVQDLEKIRYPFCLYLTHTDKLQNATVKRLKSLGAAQIVSLRVENRGRDLRPFLQIIQSQDFKNCHDVYLKIHTKVSPWVNDTHERLLGVKTGEQWRRRMISTLIPESREMSAILAHLVAKPNDILCDKNDLIDCNFVEDENSEKIQQLFSILEKDGVITNPPSCGTFIAGSMFWLGREILDAYSRVILPERYFEKERHQDNLTGAHALERIAGVLAKEKLGEIKPVQEICFQGQ